MEDKLDVSILGDPITELTIISKVHLRLDHKLSESVRNVLSGGAEQQRRLGKPQSLNHTFTRPDPTLILQFTVFFFLSKHYNLQIMFLMIILNIYLNPKTVGFA